MIEQAKPYERAMFRIRSAVQYARERVTQFGQSVAGALPEGNQLVPVGPEGQTFSQIIFMATSEEGKGKKKKVKREESIFDRINREAEERKVTGSDTQRPLGRRTPEMIKADKRDTGSTSKGSGERDKKEEEGEGKK